MTDFVCPTNHRHAEVGTCYVIHKCRCDPCRKARTASAKQRSRLQAYGRYTTGLTDAAPVREHLQYLQSCGLGWKRIAALTGVGNTAIETLIYGRKGSNTDPRKGEVLKRTTTIKAEKILALTPDLNILAPGALIPARGTHRRIHALVAIGWSQSKLATRLEILPSNFTTMMHRKNVTVKMHQLTAALYAELWDKEPPHETAHQLAAYNRSKTYARKHHWVPPIAWDDIDNDTTPPAVEPNVLLDDIAIELAISGEPVRLNGAERREAIRQLHARKWSDVRIADRLHIADRTVWRIRQELGLEAFDFGDLRQVNAA
jgi:Homeodomain-like domain